MRQRIAVVGGGVAGLSIAYEIIQIIQRSGGGPEVLCLEAEDRPGGNVRTDFGDGYVVEWGPNGFLDNVPATLHLARRLGLEERLLPADASAHDRFIFRKGRLRKLPTGPLSFIASDVLSLRGRLRVLCEPFGPGPPRVGNESGVGSGSQSGSEPADESVFDFARRRIGTEAARVLVGAMVTGVYAGDAERLSLRSTFPKMFQMEREHGTLTQAMLRKRKDARARRRLSGGSGAGGSGAGGSGAGGSGAGGPAGPGGKLTSFRGGLQELIDALARTLGPALKTRSRVTALASLPEGGYHLTLAHGETIDASAVILACPSWRAAEATSALDSELSATLAEIPSAPLVVLHLGFGVEDLPTPAAGFGFLVPRGEGPRILGTIWASSIFPGRAPPGKVLLTTMVGGAHDPDATDLPDDRLIEIVRQDLRTAMGIEKPPCFVRVFRHPRGIPQYTLGHADRLERAARRLEAHPGISLAGNSYRGISVNNCADEAPRIAERTMAFLAGRGAGK
jgi:oxygen-dependent protoporphyrinogen oxidase